MKNLKAGLLTIKGHVFYEPHIKGQILCEIHKAQQFILIEASHHHTVYLQEEQTPEISEQSMTFFPFTQGFIVLAEGKVDRKNFLLKKENMTTELAGLKWYR